ncbi:hypothetical protein [Xanthomonas cassavae]|uniref:hypothetical protein n=1 Tax=Xanthomonas cassavae TaxID=56450 RepID=UPI0030DBC716
MQGIATVHLGRAWLSEVDLSIGASLPAKRLSKCCDRMVAVFNEIGKRQAEIAIAACQVVVVKQVNRKKEVKIKKNAEKTSCIYIRLLCLASQLHHSTICCS